MPVRPALRIEVAVHRAVADRVEGQDGAVHLALEVGDLSPDLPVAVRAV